MKHKHHDCIVAWANGATIERYNVVSKNWIVLSKLQWNEEDAYRIQQPPKQKIILEAWLSEFGYLAYKGHPKLTPLNNPIGHKVRVPEFDKEIEIE